MSLERDEVNRMREETGALVSELGHLVSRPSADLTPEQRAMARKASEYAQNCEHQLRQLRDTIPWPLPNGSMVDELERLDHNLEDLMTDEELGGG